MTSPLPIQVRGKTIGPNELKAIRRILRENNRSSRTAISRQVCALLGWLQPNGKPQDVACREILRRLEALELIRLPLGIHNGCNDRKKRGREEVGDELPLGEALPEILKGKLKDFGTARLELVETKEDSSRWRALIARHHYLGYVPMAGRSLKYFIYLANRCVGTISWGSPAWKLACRDRWIGWDAETRANNLQGIAGNHRFLILPHVRIKNLASHVLGLAARQVCADWWKRYRVRLYLLESFVDPKRFRGTCYKAANWMRLGQSKGASKSGNGYRWHGQVKDVYILPLGKEARQSLCRS